MFHPPYALQNIIFNVAVLENVVITITTCGRVHVGIFTSTLKDAKLLPILKVVMILQFGIWLSSLQVELVKSIRAGAWYSDEKTV